jgi:hypothetical protein
MPVTSAPSRRKYDPNLTIRVPHAVREALQAMARQRDSTITEVVLEQIKQFEQFASDAGQESYRKIHLAIAESVTFHKTLPANGALEAWRDVAVLKYEDGSGTIYGHHVRQCEGKTRQEAVRAYAYVLWKDWAGLPDSMKDAFVDEVTDPSKHVFVVGFIGFKEWKRFPSAYEASLHRVQFVEQRSDDNDLTMTDATFLGNAVRQLDSLWQSYQGVKEGRIRLQQDEYDAPGCTSAHVLAWYPHVTERENIDAWAWQVLKAWHRADCPDAATFLTTTGRAVDVLTIEDGV